jgi:hypothetical protein
MGLDVWGYRGLVPSGQPVSDDYDYDRLVNVYVAHECHRDRLPPLVEGLNWFTEQKHFLEIPYRAYSYMRDEIARAAGWAPIPDCPADWIGFPHTWACIAASDPTRSGKLWRLINFADNEGWIGSESCKIIAEELEEVIPKMVHRRDQAEQLLAAFQFAAVDGGGVKYS